MDEALAGAHGSRKLCQGCLGADGHGHSAWVVLLDTAGVCPGVWASCGSASSSLAHCGILGILQISEGSEGSELSF